jgi:hypothetical protein
MQSKWKEARDYSDEFRVRSWSEKHQAPSFLVAPVLPVDPCVLISRYDSRDSIQACFCLIHSTTLIRVLLLFRGVCKSPLDKLTKPRMVNR